MAMRRRAASASHSFIGFASVAFQPPFVYRWPLSLPKTNQLARSSVALDRQALVDCGAQPGAPLGQATRAAALQLPLASKAGAFPVRRYRRSRSDGPRRVEAGAASDLVWGPCKGVPEPLNMG